MAKTTILSGSVNVTATLNEESLEGLMYVYDLAITRNASTYTCTTTICGVRSNEEALSVLKESIGWKDNYLFVRVECGGGNAWRCNREQVFVIRREKLVRIGEILGGERGEKPGRYYQDGYFIDYYDKLETNSLTSHAGAPGISLYSERRIWTICQFPSARISSHLY